MSYIGMAANLVGGILQSIAASEEQKAMFREYERELERQRGYQRQDYRLFQGSLPTLSSETAKTQISQGAGERTASYGKVENTPLTLGSGGFTGADRSRLDLLGQQRANVGGFSDWSLNQAINKIRLGEDMRKIANFAQGTASVFPYRMFQAQHSADELDFWGKTIASIGGGQGWGSQPPKTPTSYGTDLGGGPVIGNNPGVQGGVDYNMDGGGFGGFA